MSNTQVSKKWADLGPRVKSAVVMAIIGAVAILSGGFIYAVLVAAVTGMLYWELFHMLGTKNAEKMRLTAGSLAIITLMLSAFLLTWYGFLILIFVACVMAVLMDVNLKKFAPLAVLVAFGAYGLLELRLNHGLWAALWLILVVVFTDIGGYVAGRIFGGPKFWPQISPKKTWSGTIAGWALAAVVGILYASSSSIGAELVIISVFVSFASQMGDILESAFKRKQGIKDSSDLIPGHGGFFDRFDGMIGAASFVTLLAAVGAMPMIGG
ncbi:MAG: phosphatidate cytidylyltransferase [Halocynthiibacter sp.]